MKVDNWEGPELAGPSSRALLGRWLPVLVSSGVVEAVRLGRMSDAACLLAGAGLGDAILLSVLDGWTVDGVALSPAVLDGPMCEPDRLLEPWEVLLHVLIVSGFFGVVRRGQVLKQIAKLAAKAKKAAGA